MAGEGLRSHGEQFLLAARSHAECHAGRLIKADDKATLIELDLNVEMPIDFKVDGASPNGVRTTETVTVRLWPDYPWSSPSFYLRMDFPRDLPHLQPGPLTELPRPCLIDGNPREYFFQFGLVELGVFNLVHQLVLWLQRAAEGTLIHHGSGWEPTLRRDLSDAIAIDAEACRAAVDRNGGYRVLKSRYYRLGADECLIGREVRTWLNVSQKQVPLKRDDNELFVRRKQDGGSSGDTVCCLVWPDKLPTGDEFVAGSYMPETVDTYRRLLERADELDCGRALRVFFDNLERCFQGFNLEAPIPVAIILCARRPCPLVGSQSNIELLPYVLDIRAMKKRSSLLASGDGEPVAPAMQIDATNPTLLRNVSGAPVVAPVAMIGCGSVGSKMAMHLARSGIKLPVVSDNGSLRPHNMARHALARAEYATSKAVELAKELEQLGQSPAVQQGDAVVNLAARETRKIVLPKEAGYAINTTASLSVREALSVLAAKDIKPRLAEAALFGRGDGGFLLVEGVAHNPTLCDLVAELYASITDDRLRKLLFDPAFGLTEVQIGQGCGSLTMPMTDMRLSAMTAALTEEFVGCTQNAIAAGSIIIGSKAETSSDTAWRRQNVLPFEVVDIEGPEGWTLRLSQSVLEKIRSEVARYPTVETGGLLIGMCSARLKAVTVVDLIDAPPDSVRSASRFVLGTEGLKAAITARHRASGNTLFDVGTWHSHLADQGPSALDRATAKELAEERPPPSVLLIAAPTRLYSLMHKGASE
jgi:Prokaryotic E2 family A/ThiF family/Prokaryotic homologs of the JAB domain